MVTETDRSSFKKKENYRVVEASFVTSAPKLAACPEATLPEIAIAGRSNVGKSSLINFICNRKNLAKTSNTPGKTRLINYFLLRIEPGNHHVHLVDLPGFGYAKTSKKEQEYWGKSLDEFLQKRETLCGMLQLVDSRHDPTDLDLQLREWILHTGIPALTILTKTDKLGKNVIAKSRKNVKRMMKIWDDEECILSSALKKQGKQEMINGIMKLIVGR